MFLSLKQWLEKPNRMVVVCLLVIAAGVVLNVVSVRVFPGFQAIDEPWYINYADVLTKTGHIGATLVLDNLAGRAGIVQQYLAAAWQALLGQDILAQRYLATIAGLLLLPVVYGIGVVLQDWRVGLYATTLLAINLVWLAVSHIGRPDTLITLAIWASFLLFMMVRQAELKWLAFIAGLLAALTTTIHPTGAVLCVSVAIWWLLDWPTVRGEWRLVLLYAAGGLSGALVYFILQVLPSIPDFIASLNVINTLVGIPATPGEILLDQQTTFFAANPLQAILTWYGLLWAFRNRGQARRLAVFTVIFTILLAIFVNYKNMYYEVYYMPGLTLAFALALRQVSWPRNYSRIILLGGLVLVTIAINVNVILKFSTDNWNGRVVTDMKEVAAAVPAQGQVVASPIFYLAFRDSRFLGYTPFVETFDLARIAPEFIISVKDPLAFGPKSYAMTNPTLMWIYISNAYAVYKTIDTSTGEYIIYRRKGN